MAYLQSSGAISLSQVQGHWGGGNPISMSEYYRNGSYVPSIYTETTTTTTTTNQPSSGFLHTVPSTRWFTVGGVANIYWNSSSALVTAAATATSVTSGGWTYYRGTLMVTQYTLASFSIRRQQTTTSSSTTTTNINTGIPSSGTISMNQFYGGRN